MKLEIRDLHAGYGAVRALMGVSLDMNQGQTVALLGTNGNGKSTLMKCIMGMVKPESGSIRLSLDGVSHDLTQLSTEEIVNLGVALVPEGRRLFPKLTVEENLLLGAFRPLAREHLANNLDFAFEAFPLLNYVKGGRAIDLAFMRVPDRLLDEPEEFAVWARSALHAAYRVAAERGRAKNRRT